MCNLVVNAFRNDYKNHELPGKETAGAYFKGIENQHHFTKDAIVSIIGSRRAGKTFYFYQLMSNINEKDKNRILYLDFEYPELAGITFKEIIISRILRMHSLFIQSTSFHIQ